MKVLIIEDEKPAAEHIQNLVKRFDTSIEVLGPLDAVRKSVDWFNNNPHPDLVMMDIQLADGLSFEIFEKTVVKCPVIFTTAFNDYAIRAFKVNSVDYLLKPIDFEELTKAFEKFQNTYQKQDVDKFATLMDQVLNGFNKEFKQRFVIKVGEHIKSVRVEDILYFYSMEKATFLLSNNNHNYVIDYSLEQVEEMVDPGLFFRINRKYLVNIDSIEDIISYSNSRLKLELKNSKDHDAIVAREKVSAFKKWLDR
ncbi:MAG TPA: LytTR family DNA-binding domain-containing protein [Bacteroidales bacterium]|nr:LytTR family DNA-binding domain-containing protein [Bacteroidales bacterium]